MNNQTFDMVMNITDELERQKFPLEIIYGPERLSRPGQFGFVIIFERDREANDAWQPAKGAQSNPDMRGVRGLAIKVTIFAKSSLPDATIWEHEFECEQLVDAWLTAQEEWGRASRAGYIPVTSARYLKPSERDDVEAWAGCVYEIKAVLPRGAYKRDFTGAARPVGQATAVTGVVEVKQNENDTPETIPLPSPESP